MNPYEQFRAQCLDQIDRQVSDVDLNSLTSQWVLRSLDYQYSYHFEWAGRPIIQYPQDIIAMQELIWSVKPDLIIETGIAHGGSLMLSASMLALLDFADASKAGIPLDPRTPQRQVCGIDIDIRSHNRAAIESHPFKPYIRMIEGSSIDPEIVSRIHALARDFKRILVCLDSNHTHDHVFAELEAYASLVTPGSYCVVFDTIIQDLPDAIFPNRPWGVNNNPKTAVSSFLERHPEFQVDTSIDNKLLISAAPKGYLRRVSEDTTP